jgi:hypothetical protein
MAISFTESVMEIYIPATSSRYRAHPQILEQPQKIAIRIGDNELPIADLVIVAPIPFLFERQIERHSCCL